LQTITEPIIHRHSIQETTTMKPQTFLDELQKVSDRDFLIASLAASALVAMADGVISAKEKQKMVKFIDGYGQLALISMDEIISLFQGFVRQIESDRHVGEAKAYAILRKIKNNSEHARLLVQMIIGIGQADGFFDEKERLITTKIIIELGLVPAEFDL
jgi:tellurite resistance protein TerB